MISGVERPRAAVAGALFALLLAHGCSSQQRETGDETHFQCIAQRDCDLRAPGTECLDGYCREVRDASTERTSDDETGTSSGGAPGSGGASASGGSLAIAETGASGGSDAGTDDFAACESPPDSSCSREDWCKRVDCGGLEYDAMGCHRTGCDDDGPCASTERCVFIGGCQRPTHCTASGSECTCDVAGCIQGGRCNPVAEVGPRGDWLDVTVAVSTPLCASGEPACSKHTLTPDGKVLHETARATLTEQTTLTEADLFYFMNGLELRRALQKGLDCGVENPDTSLAVTLRTTEETVVRSFDVQCIADPEANVLGRLSRDMRVALYP